MNGSPNEKLNIIAQTLFDKKGFNILALDVRAVCTLTEYFVIGEGNIDRHVSALGQAVVERLRKEGDAPLHTEGVGSGDWVVIDYGEIIIHLFTPAMREKYKLEELWQKGEIVDLEFQPIKSKVSDG